MNAKIGLQPVGSVDEDILRFLEGKLSYLGRIALLPPVQVPEVSYDPLRRQYRGDVLLLMLPGLELTLAVADVDAYVEGLNFVFGLALGKRAIIFLRRLRPEFYGLPGDRDLLQTRALKEAVHELGHVYGLGHCPERRCVMHFSNSLSDTDYKSESYCPQCRKRLPRT